MAEQDIELAKKFPFLTHRELVAYRNYAGLAQPPLAQSTAEGFYSLFEMGRTCLDIVKLNKGFSLGQVIQCRIDNKWDERLREETEQLAADTLNVVSKVKLQSLRYQADLVSAHHKLYGQQISKFLQTGDPGELVGVPIPAYRTLIQQLAESTTTKDAQIKIEIKTNGPVGEIVDGQVVRKVEPADLFKKLASKIKSETE